MAVLNLGLSALSVSGSLLLAGSVLSLVNDSASPGNDYYYGTNGSGTKGWYALSAEGVNSITGTAGQVVASASTGAITLSLASALTSINSITSAAGQNLVLALGTGGTALTLTSSTLAATFAGAVTVSSTLSATAGGTSVVISGSATYNAIRFNLVSTAQGFVGSDYGQALCTTSTNGDIVIRADATGSVLFSSTLTQTFKVGTTGAITLGSASSITAATTTDLTLAGGSSGATLVLGQGANGAVTITPKGTGAIIGQMVSDRSVNVRALAVGAVGTALDVWAGNTARNAYQPLSLNGSTVLINTDATGNLLIGGTTDITGSGGLKVFGTTAASSITTGAFQCAGGVGIAGAAFFGGAVNATTSTTHTWGAGGTTASELNRFVLNGSSGSAAGSTIYIQSAGTNKSYIGRAASVLGGTSDSLLLYSVSDSVLIYGAATLSGTFSSTGLTIAPTTASTSTTTGSIINAGGFGNAGAFFNGGDATITGDLTVTGGNVGVGSAPNAAFGLRVDSTGLAGVNQDGLVVMPTFTSSATSSVTGVYIKVIKANEAFATTTGYGAQIDGPTVDADTTIGTLYGLRIENQGATGITDAYGVDIAAQSGAATVNIGLRSAGVVSVTNSTASTSTTTGSIINAGGFGNAGAGVFGTTVSIGAATAPASGSALEITKASTYNSESSAGISIQTTTATDSKLLLGADATNDICYIQSMQAGTSYGTRPLWINPNGSNVVIGVTGTTNFTSILSTQAATSTTNGALQVAGGVGIAGGIYAGSTSVFASASGAATQFSVSNSVAGAWMTLSGTTTNLIDSSHGLIFRTNGTTTALTLDTSQNATIAGDLTVSGSTGITASAGDLEAQTSGKGLILKAPSGARWRVTIDNAGQLSTTAL